MVNFTWGGVAQLLTIKAKAKSRQGRGDKTCQDIDAGITPNLGGSSRVA